MRRRGTGTVSNEARQMAVSCLLLDAGLKRWLRAPMARGDDAYNLVPKVEKLSFSLEEALMTLH